MKKALSVLATLAACNFSAISQTNSSLRIDPEHVIRGRTVRIVYQASAYSAFSKKDSLVCRVYKSYNPGFVKNGLENIKLLKKGDHYEGTFKTSDSIILVSMIVTDKINSRLKDDNTGKGYQFLVYDKKNKPVQGALAYQAMIVGRESGLSGEMNQISKLQDSLFTEEYKLHPTSRDNASILSMNYFAKSSVGDTAALKSIANEIRRNIGNKVNNNEFALSSALDVFNTAKMQDAADSVKKLLVQKFPKGRVARIELGIRIDQTKDSLQLQTLYKTFKDSFEPYQPSEMQQMANLVRGFASKGFIQAIQDFEGKITDQHFKANIYNSYAWNRAEADKDLDSALKYSDKSLKILEEIKSSTPPLADTRFLEGINNSYQYFADTYAFILYKKGNYTDALKYQELAFKAVKNPIDAVKERYAMLLQKNNRSTEAKPLAEEVFMKKQSKDKITLLLAVYKDEHGTEDGFNDYLEKLRSNISQFKKDQIAKEMIKEAAPAFSVKTLDGNTVTLADLKGKVVILDFWATWCGPCVASFPGMAAAQEKLKTNADVVFLFVNTWENKPETARKFLQENKYGFTAVMDNFHNGTYSIATEYKVQGIPTKFVIDKEGYIRFKKVGFSGNIDTTVDEISTMVQLSLEGK